MKEVGCQCTFEEKVSGAKRDRPELAKMVEQLRDNDTVVVTRLDRLARSTRDLLDVAEFEGEVIYQRTSSGRVAAKARGVRFGRPLKLIPEQITLGEPLVSEGTSVREAAKLLKYHRATLYRA